MKHYIKKAIGIFLLMLIIPTVGAVCSWLDGTGILYGLFVGFLFSCALLVIAFLVLGALILFNE